MPYKCVIAPDQASYNVRDGREVNRTQLQGGRGRYRKDILNSSRVVTVSWTVGREDYEYLRSFYRVMVAQASTPFKIDLILDKSSLTEHDAFFIPDTMNLQRIAGHTHTLAAQLEVVPIQQDFQFDSYFIALRQEYGLRWQIQEDLIDKLINVDIPDALQ